MTPPLKPCPFCGSAPTGLRRSFTGWMVYCDAPECHARPYVFGETESIAVEKWEWRAVPSSVLSAIEEEANAARHRNEAHVDEDAQVCSCGHRYRAHAGRAFGYSCCAPGCDCVSFMAGRTT